MTLRERLRARPSKLPTAEARIPADPAAVAALEQTIALLEAALLSAVADGVEAVDAVQDQLDVARAELANQPVEVFTFRCLPPRRWDQLTDEHPPTDEERRNGWQWHVETYRPAVLAACHVPGDEQDALDVRGWEEVALEGEMSPGELELLFATAVRLNTRQPSEAVGKGSPQTRS